MSESDEFWAAWHPTHGFSEPYGYEGAVVFADIDSAIRRVKGLNEDDGTNNRNGWRAVKVQIVRADA